MKRILIFFLMITTPIFAQNVSKEFNSLDMIQLRTQENSVYEIFTIGNYSQSYPAKRWLKSFEINKYETTYEFWYSIKNIAKQLGYNFKHSGRPGSLGKTGSTPNEDTKYQPVTFISWYDAVVWCNALSEIYQLEPCYKYVTKDGIKEVLKDSTETSKLDLAICEWENSGYRLPTEAEWEYAAIKIENGFMGGDLVSGQIQKTDCDFEDIISEDEVSWTISNTNRTHIVGTAGNYEKNAIVGTGKSNYIGAFDMGGNVLEFCWDWFEQRYSEVEPGKFATGIEYGSDRVCRGGSFSPLTIFCSAGDRYQYDPNEYYDFLGFRLARTIQSTTSIINDGGL